MSRNDKENQDNNQDNATNNESEAKPQKRRRVVFDKSAASIRGDVYQKVRTAKKRTVQSARWLERQLNDPYVKLAKSEGYRSRAAFKLIEIDDQFSLIKPNSKVLDLGAAPGGWCQIAQKRGAKNIVGVDLLDIDPIEGVTLLKGDFTEPEIQAALLEALGEKPNLIISDMAANTVGHRQTDHLRTAALAQMAADFAIEFLERGGSFVTKVFQGGSQADTLNALKHSFKSVKHFKPNASRKESVELYLIAIDKK